MEKLLAALEQLLDQRPDHDERERENNAKPGPGKISRTHAGHLRGMRRQAAPARRPGKATLTASLMPAAGPVVAMRETAPPVRGASGRAVRDSHGPDGSRPAGLTDDLVAALLSTPGARLGDHVRARFERALGRDLGNVRVHVDDSAARAAEQIGAQAFTLGRDIFFARGAFAPGTPTGDRVLAHELTHVVQSEQGRMVAAGTEADGPARADDALEHEAYRDEDAILERLRHADGADGAVIGDVRGPDSHAESARPRGGDHTVGAPAASDPSAALARRDDPGEPTTPGAAADAEGTGEAQPPTEEEIQAMIRDAQQQGGAQPTPEAEAEGDADAEPPVEPGQESGPDAGQPPGQAVQPAQTGGATPQLAATPPTADGALPSFEQLKDGPLANWDEEVAWHEYFAGGGGATGGGIQIDRDALIRDAVLGGLGDGAVAGLKDLAIDTLINVASSKIPYLQGFVEMARIAYDPAAWFESTSQATVGKIATGVDQLIHGDFVDKIEGLLNILDGLNGIIGTASSICWIVAAAGFVLSFICPAVLPFVALAAQWAVTLGTISTLVGVYITLARAGVMLARAAQIKWGDANPQELLEQGERLRAQSTAFGQEFTVRAGNSLRERAQTRLQQRPASQATQPSARTNRSSGTQPTRMQRIRGVLAGGARVVGETAFAGIGGSNIRTGGQQIRETAGQAARTTQAFAGTGEFGGGGPRTTRQQLADMESAGAQVHHSDAQRRRVDQRLADQGEGRPVNRERQQLLEVRQQRQQEFDDAVQRRDDTAAAAQRARDHAQEAQAALQRARAEHGDTIDAAQTNAAAQRALHEQATADVAHQRGVRDAMQRMQQEALDAGDTQRADIIRQAMLQQDIKIADAEIREINARHNVVVAEADLTIARHPVDMAEARAEGTQQGITARDRDAADAAAAVGPANERLNEAKVDVNVHDLPGGQTRAQAQAQADREAGYRLLTDFTGSSTNDLMGHNKGAGKTGAGTALVNEVIAGNERQEGQGEQGEQFGGPLGSWSRTSQLMNDPDAEMDLIGNAGARGQGQDYAGQLQARYDQLTAALPAPPMSAPGRIDQAAQSYQQLDEEQRQIQFQQQVITEMQAEGDECMTALDAVQALSEANQEALGQHQGELETRRAAQDELAEQGTQLDQNAQQSQNKGQEGQSAVGGFLDGFIQLMGMIPSSLVSNAGEGASGARQIDQGVRGQGESASDTAAAGQETQQEATRMQGETDGAMRDADQVGQEFQGLDSSISEQQLAATDGAAFLQDAMTQSDARLQEIAQEKQQAQADQQAAISEATTWVGGHAAIRSDGLGELDGLVELADPQGQAGGGE